MSVVVGLKLSFYMILSRFYRIISVEASGTEREPGLSTGGFQSFQADIPQAVRADLLADLLQRHPVGDEIFLTVNVGAEMAAVAKGC